MESNALFTFCERIQSDNFKMHFAVDQTKFQLFCLTSDGEDVSNCGRTVETACKTLHQILNIYYKTSGIPPYGLEIITSKSLITIDKQLMVSILRILCMK